MAPGATTVTETTPSQSTAAIVAAAPAAKNNAAFFDEVHFLGDKDGKVVIRSPPVFANKEDERTYQKQHLAAAFRVFAKQGFDEGVAGHISLRDPINPGTPYTPRQWIFTVPPPR